MPPIQYLLGALAWKSSTLITLDRWLQVLVSKTTPIRGPLSTISGRNPSVASTLTLIHLAPCPCTRSWSSTLATNQHGLLISFRFWRRCLQTVTHQVISKLPHLLAWQTLRALCSLNGIISVTTAAQLVRVARSTACPLYPLQQPQQPPQPRQPQQLQ